MSNVERRARLRYRDPNTPTLRFVIKEGDTEMSIKALMVNESHSGLACVYIGQGIEVGKEIFWQETKHIQTPCRVMRCETLYRDVFLLAVQLVR
jgi:hypothetical protein